MKYQIAAFTLLLLVGCQAPKINTSQDEAPVIRQVQIQSLPKNLNYKQLVHLWGEGVETPACYAYATETKDIFLAIVEDPEDSEKIGGIYYVGGSKFKDVRGLAWGRDVLDLLKNKELQK